MNVQVSVCALATLLCIGSPASLLSGQATTVQIPSPRLSESVIRPGDVLRISVWPDDKLGGEFPVEESGYVYLPILGQVRAAGVDLQSLRGEIRLGFSRAMQNPVVTVTPLARVSVLGAVLRPGLYVVDPTHSLIDVISMAGGFRPDANDSKIRIIRDGQVIEVNTRRALETGDAVDATYLLSVDRVVVPYAGSWRRGHTETVMWVLQSALLVTTIVTRARR
jgi:protein involved in polysaccharide export with SLBB domain